MGCTRLYFCFNYSFNYSLFQNPTPFPAYLVNTSLNVFDACLQICIYPYEIYNAVLCDFGFGHVPYLTNRIRKRWQHTRFESRPQEALPDFICSLVLLLSPVDSTLLVSGGDDSVFRLLIVKFLSYSWRHSACCSDVWHHEGNMTCEQYTITWASVEIPSLKLLSESAESADFLALPETQNQKFYQKHEF